MKIIGATGFEPATTPTPRVYATKLRHAPKTLYRIYQKIFLINQILQSFIKDFKFFDEAVKLFIATF